jgi:hypothetical protein
MTRENFEKVLRVFLARAPFEPFTIELISGSRVEVNHPEAVELRKDIVVFKSTRGTYVVFECSAVVRFVDATGTT